MGKFNSAKVKKKRKELVAREERLSEKRNRAFVKSHKSADGDNLFRFFEPKTDSDFPWEEKGIHYSCGPERKEQFACMRIIADEDHPKFQPISKCPQCKDNDAKFKTKQKSSIALAKRRNRKNRFLLEGINLTSLIPSIEQGDVPKPKKCFGNYVFRDDDDGYEKCQKCVKKNPWGPVCSEGVGVLVIGPTIADPLMDNAGRIADDLGNNPFSIKKGHNFSFTRTGKELKTKYTNVGFGLSIFKLPDVVIEFIKANRVDWEQVYPLISKEEMIARMKGVEADIEDEDDDDDDELDTEASEDSEDVDVDEDSDDDDDDEDSDDEDDDSDEDTDSSSEDDDEDDDDDDEDEGDDDDSDEDESDEDEDSDDDSDSDDEDDGDDEAEDSDEEDEKFFREIEEDVKKSKGKGKGSLEKKLNEEAKKKKKTKKKKAKK